MRVFGLYLIGRKEALELSTTLAETRALRMAVTTLTERVGALLASNAVAKKQKVSAIRKGRK